MDALVKKAAAVGKRCEEADERSVHESQGNGGGSVGEEFLRLRVEDKALAIAAGEAESEPFKPNLYRLERHGGPEGSTPRELHLQDKVQFATMTLNPDG